jgi:aspartyl-tRNA(Asn)/glutamyl-tRNA(Gln) amidotransferase subunit A
MQACIRELSDQIRRNQLSPVELTQYCLSRIEKLNPLLNAFITVNDESALRVAREAEAEIQKGNWRGPLHGIPIGLKDLIDTAGLRTTAASALHKDRIPTEDAEVVTQLKAAGAILIGKQNLHEFAYGGSSIISYFGPVRNPWNPDHIAGGSSGGSAAAVAAEMCCAAIGTDTGGSIREPASLCGVVGLKPTFGRVSARGVIPLSPSLDHVGPIARTVADAAVVLQAIAGYDSRDPNSGNVPVPDYVTALEQTPARVRVGVPRKFFYENLDAETALVIEEALSVLEKQGADVRDTELKIPIDWSLLSAEAYACHAEFIRRSPELYQPETLRRLRAGESISAAEVDARRHELKNYRSEIDGVFKQIDVLVTPTTPHPAPRLAGLTENPDQLRPTELTLLSNTRPFNMWGLPTISVPCGFTHSGLPIGLQIAGAQWAEALVLQVAHAYEQATQWLEKEPRIPVAN